MNNYKLLIVLHHHRFFHLLNKIQNIKNKKNNNRNSNLLLPVSGTAFPVSSLPEIPNNFPPEDFVELVNL
jgi:hypothetical protein